MISEEPVNEENFEVDLPLKIIKHFEAEQEWILEAGDMLYLPPNVAHYGIGLEDCITFSIGFRAPSHAELLSSYLDEHITTLKDDLRYQDPTVLANQNSGEITSEVINNIQAIMLSHFSDKSKIEDWFGRFITNYLNDDEYIPEDALSINNFIDTFKDKGLLRRPATVRANYLFNQANKITLFINGNILPIKESVENIAMLFCNQHLLHYNNLKSELENDSIIEFLSALYNMGYLEFPDK